MEDTVVPPLGWAVFCGAWVASLSLFVFLFQITRRLGMSWQRHLGGVNLKAADAMRLGKLLFGLEAPPKEANVGTLLWIVRGCWLAMVLLVVAFALVLAGVA